MSTHGGGTSGGRARASTAATSAAADRVASYDKPIHTFQEIPPAHYTSEADSAAELALRALNTVTTTGRYADWEQRVVRSEQARYLRGDVTPPKARPAPAKETLAAANKRLAEDTLRNYLWLYHGPGRFDAPRAALAATDQRYQQLRSALNDNVRRLSEHNAELRIRAALRTYGNVPGMRDLLHGHPLAFRWVGSPMVSYHILRPTGPLTANGMRVQAYELGRTTPYGERTSTLEQLAHGVMADNNFHFDRALAPDWSPVPSGRGRMARVASEYGSMQSNVDQSGRAPLAEQMLAYTGSATPARATRAKKSA